MSLSQILLSWWCALNAWVAEPFDRTYRARLARKKAALREAERTLKWGARHGG